MLDLDLDKVGGQKRTNFKAREVLLDCMHGLNLVDVFRVRNPKKRLCTWFSNITSGLSCRLDFILLSANLLARCHDCYTMSAIQSDHNAVIVKIRTSSFKRGSGFWKLNVSLLKDLELVEGIRKLISDASMNWDINKQNLQNFWEYLKFLEDLGL